MGNARNFKSTGCFKGYLYESQSARVNINGVTGKIVKLKSDKDGTHSNLPQYADTSDMYFQRGKDGNVIQDHVYIERRMTIDFDWGHTHTNKKGDGATFPEGTVHVQVSHIDSKGNIVRDSQNARWMTDYEIRTYGPIIHHFAPNAKFR